MHPTSIQRPTHRSRATSSLCALTLFWAATLPFATKAGPAIHIGAIEITGNARITAASVADSLGLKVGDAFDDDAADHALKALYATGLYRDVSIHIEDRTVIVRVEENPLLAGVTTSGHKTLDAKALMTAATLKPGMPYTPAKARTEAKRIAALYRTQGRPETHVEPRVFSRPDGRIDLAFDVIEGALKKVARIVFTGNVAFSDTRLKDLMATTEAGWLDAIRNSSTVDEARFAVDRALILKAYRNQGYADATVAPPGVAAEPGSNDVRIQIAIDEGRRYMLGPLRIESRIDGFDASRLEGKIQVRAGQVYDADALEAATDRIALDLAENGPEFAEVHLTLERDPVAGTVTPVFRVERRKALTIERIVVIGNRATDERIVRRDLSLAEGRPFSLALAKRDKAKLERSGLFKTVEIQATGTTQPGAVRVDVIVTEEDTRKIDYGIGYSSTEGVTGDAAIGDNNLLGTGTRLKLAVAASEARWETSLGFTEPRLFDSLYSAGFDLLYRDVDRTLQSSYQMRTYGGDVRVGVPLAEHLTASVKYGAVVNEIYGVGANASAAIRETIPGFPTQTTASYLTSSIGAGLTWDDRDKPRMATSGTYLALTQDFAGVGGDVRYLRTTADARAYLPLSRDVTLGARAVAGTIVGWGGDDVRLIDMFYKGSETVRGFASAGIGPRDTASANLDALGGTTYVAASTEARFNLPYVPESTGLKGEVFADAGSLFGTNKTAAVLLGLAGATASPRASIGTGLVWDSPLGAFRLDYALPLVKQSFDKTQALSFGMVP